MQTLVRIDPRDKSVEYVEIENLNEYTHFEYENMEVFTKSADLGDKTFRLKCDGVDRTFFGSTLVKVKSFMDAVENISWYPCFTVGKAGMDLGPINNFY